MTGTFAAVFCLAFILFNLFSLALLGWRCRLRKEPLASRLLKTGLAEPTPPVSIVRPVWTGNIFGTDPAFDLRTRLSGL